MRSAIVLGGGMVGVATALHLQSRGWSVVLVDRNEPGRETSYGNAGIIQSEAVRPYAMPHDIGGIFDIATGRTTSSPRCRTICDRCCAIGGIPFPRATARSRRPMRA
jgi:flavin-dependent dehydrogenase